MSAAGTGRIVSQKLAHLLHPSLSHSLTALPTFRSLLALHAHLLVSGLLSSSPFAASRLLASAALSPSASLSHARLLFSSLPVPTLFSFNTMIRASSQGPEPIQAVRYYIQMLRLQIPPDSLTFPFLLRSCSAFPNLGRGLHCHVAKLGLGSDIFVANNSISMYSGWGDMSSAHQLFDEIGELADVVTWTAMIAGYSNCGRVDDARWVFDRSPARNSVTWNAMIAAYARVGRSGEARRLFDEMPERNAETWASLVSGLAQCGLCKEALSVFKDTVRSGIRPNESTLVSAVSACAQLRALEEGEKVHGYVEENKVEMSVILGTAFVDMYGKCGSISMALRVFHEMPVKNVFSWNSMITGLAMNGASRQALALFWKMRLAGVVPNAITFIGLLTACSHSGLVDEGRQLFDMMVRVHSIRPLEEHYGCMVDLLGRAGLIKEAVDFVEGMPVEPHPGLWGALAGACRVHGEVELGEEVGKRLIELEPDHGGRYVLLANIYGAARRWDDMAMVRKLLRERRVAKVAGNSLVEAWPAISS